MKIEQANTFYMHVYKHAFVVGQRIVAMRHNEVFHLTHYVFFVRDCRVAAYNASDDDIRVEILLHYVAWEIVV